MLQFLANENFNNQIVRGVLRRNPDVDLVRVQDVGLSEADDPTVGRCDARRNYRKQATPNSWGEAVIPSLAFCKALELNCYCLV